MKHTMLRPFIVKVTVLGYFPLQPPPCFNCTIDTYTTDFKNKLNNYFIACAI